MTDADKYLVMRVAWSRLGRWLQDGEIEDADLVFDRMEELEHEVIRPVTHPIRTVEPPPFEQK